MAFRSCLLACFCFAALPTLGQGMHFVHPPAGTTLAAGDEVVVRWSNAPAAAREMELLLSVDSGRRFAVRLTHELPGDATTYRWRVPLLPSVGARLALRMNLDGREVEVGTSAPFAIVSGTETGGPDGSIQLVDGELWWMEQAVAGSESERIALAGLDPLPLQPRFLPAAGESMLADLPSPEGALRPAASPAPYPAVLSASFRQGSPRPPARTPLLSPLRI